MADTSIARVALGATTLNRKWFFDVDTAGSATTPTWVGIFGVQEFKAAVSATTGDTSDFSSAWKGEQNTALSWAIEAKVKRGVTAASATAYDPGQEFLRTRAGLVGVAARVHVRWYEMEPSDRASRPTKAGARSPGRPRVAAWTSSTSWASRSPATEPAPRSPTRRAPSAPIAAPRRVWLSAAGAASATPQPPQGARAWRPSPPSTRPS